MRRFARAAVLASLAVALLPPAALADPATPPFAGETSVTLVEIPVEVERRGEPVTGLDAADFVVTSDGRTLPVVAFEPIDLGLPSTAAETAAAPTLRVPPPAARRHLFLLFDLALTHPQRAAEGVAAARELVASGLDPSDLVGVGVHLPNGALPVLLHFTTDRAAADRALAALDRLLAGERPAPVDAAAPDPLRLSGAGVTSLLLLTGQTTEHNVPADILAELATAPNEKAGAPDLQYNILSHSSSILNATVESRRRSHVRAMAEGFGDLAALLRHVQGRKLLVLWSDGLPIEVTQGIRGNVEIARGGGADTLARVDDALRELRREGWVVHGVELLGTQASRMEATGLFYLANETGGESVEGTNDFAAGLGRALEASLHAYLLTVQVDVAYDGAFHPLEVRVQGAERGTRIRHREGFHAPVPFAGRDAARRVAEASTLVASGEERDDLGVAAVAVPLRAEAGATRVALVVEVPGTTLAAAPDGRLGLEVYGYAVGADGAARDHFAYSVDLDAAEVGPRLAEGGVRVLGDLDLPAGRYGVRVLVRDRRDGRVTLRTVPVAVDGDAVGDRLDALFLPAEGDPWVLVPPSPDAFVVRGRAVLPAARATLPEGGDAPMLLLGTGFTGRDAAVTSRVLDAAGRAVAGADLELLGLTPGDGAEPDLLLGRLHAGTLPPGAYTLEVTLAGAPASTRPFVVVASST